MLAEQSAKGHQFVSRDLVEKGITNIYLQVYLFIQDLFLGWFTDAKTKRGQYIAHIVEPETRTHDTPNVRENEAQNWHSKIYPICVRMVIHAHCAHMYEQSVSLVRS